MSIVIWTRSWKPGDGNRRKGWVIDVPAVWTLGNIPMAYTLGGR